METLLLLKDRESDFEKYAKQVRACLENAPKIVSRTYFEHKGYHYSYTVWDNDLIDIVNETPDLFYVSTENKNKYARAAEAVKTLAEKFKHRIVWTSTQKSVNSKNERAGIF